MIPKKYRWFCEARNKALSCRKMWCEYDCPFADFVRTQELIEKGKSKGEAWQKVLRTAWPEGLGQRKLESVLGVSLDYMRECLRRDE